MRTRKSFLKKIKTTTIEKYKLIKYHIPNKHSSDILGVPFEAIVDTFHKDLSSNKNFVQQLLRFENVVSEIYAFKMYYGTLSDKYTHDQNIFISELYSRFNDLKELSSERIRVFDDPFNDQNHLDDYFLKLDKLCFAIDLNAGNLKSYRKFLELREMTVDCDPDDVDSKSLKIVNDIILCYRNFQNVITELKNQLKLNIETINSSAKALDEFLPNIRMKKPKRFQF